jgi:hypothetical protein
MKQKTSVKKFSVKLKRVFFILAGLFAIPLGMVAQPLPTMPPSGYDTGGLYPAGAVTGITYYSSVAGTNRDMEVYTPPNYNPNQKHGVIYAIHGIDLRRLVLRCQRRV